MIPEPEIRVTTDEAGCELCVYMGGSPIGSSMFMSWHDYDVLCNAVDSQSLSTLPAASRSFLEGLNAVVDEALLKLDEKDEAA